ncbi:MAG: hypothetical protein MJ225_03840 [Bacilli bacterium]|nr:hypothetical protein [Bacilli bacterium]
MKKIGIYAIIVSSALALGGISGFGSKKLFGTVFDDYSGFNVDIYKINGDELIRKVEAKATTKDKIASFTPIELINYSIEKYKRCDHSYSYSIGNADAGISIQKVRSSQIRDEDKYFEESASDGIIGCAMRSFQIRGENTVDIYSASTASIKDDDPIFPYSSIPLSYTLPTYKQMYGKTLDEMFIYIIHDKTVKSATIKEQKDETYVVNFELDPALSTYWYKRQMVSISDLDCQPTFDYVRLTYTLDKNLMLVSLYTDESFIAKWSGFEKSTKNTLFTKYFPNDNSRKIPELNEPFHYGEVK